MKTIFITLPIGFSVRNILYTGVINQIIEGGDVRVVAFTSVGDIAERYSSADGNLVFEPIPPRAKYTPAQLLNRMLNLRFHKMHENSGRSSMAEKRQTLNLSNPAQYLLEAALSQPLPKNKAVFRWLSVMHLDHLGTPDTILSLFSKYQPSLVFATHPTRMVEYSFLKYARRSGITTVGMIHSWDVLSTEGRIVVPVDYYLVWNRMMAEELKNFYSISDSQILVTGIPQFDVYAEEASSTKRGEFLQGQGLDPKKRTVLYATSPERIAPEEPQILERLIPGLAREFGDEIQVLVRVHPQDDFARYSALESSMVAFQRPGAVVSTLEDNRLMDQAELRRLRDTLAYCDVVVNTASTITIDSIAMDRPVINIAFDIGLYDYYNSVRRYFERVHLKPVVESGATKLADSVENLVALIRRYIDDPGLEREERASLADSICYKIDGMAGERISEFLIKALGESRVGSPAMLTV